MIVNIVGLELTVGVIVGKTRTEIIINLNFYKHL